MFPVSAVFTVFEIFTVFAVIAVFAVFAVFSVFAVFAVSAVSAIFNCRSHDSALEDRVALGDNQQVTGFSSWIELN